MGKALIPRLIPRAVTRTHSRCCSAVTRLSARFACTTSGRVYTSMGRPVEVMVTVLRDVPGFFTLILHAVTPDVHALYTGYCLPPCLMSS